MFNRKLKQRIDSLEGSAKANYKWHDDQKWVLKHEIAHIREDLALLVEALGMTKDERHINKYIKKDGPERGN